MTLQHLFGEKYFGLELVGGLIKESIKETKNGYGIKFKFLKSTKANEVLIQRYNEDYVMAFMKNGKLVSEKIVKEEDIPKVFEDVTGIYISFY